MRYCLFRILIFIEIQKYYPVTMKIGITFFAGILLLGACGHIEIPSTDLPKALATTNPVPPEPFNEYWYAGKAEINSYNLEQARYGEIRQGDAVLVFVTEPFSKEQQVKLDYPQGNKDELPVLKMNALRKFNTGIYDYSLMTSVFTPVQLEQFPNTLKANTSSQEWCGQTFTQFNLDKKEYRVSGYSYFESEGDKDFKIKADLLEDELFNRIRLRPESLPLGDIDVIPSSTYTRLLHKPIRPTKANAFIRAIESGKQYTLNYLHLERTLTIEFEATFPYKILSWSENDGGQLTKASLKESIQSDYWAKNSNRDEGMRQELGLRK